MRFVHHKFPEIIYPNEKRHRCCSAAFTKEIQKLLVYFKANFIHPSWKTPTLKRATKFASLRIEINFSLKKSLLKFLTDK
jgi:hypothetical protein